jgi:hypothetical protein
MDTCEECRKQLEQLRAAIGPLDAGADTPRDAASIKANALRLHFTFMDEPVGCGDVRPFLPTLLDPDTEVGIPTPITAHIEKCTACRKDLTTIRGLDLKAEQLQRLSQVFAERLEENSVSCSHAQTDLLFTVLMTFRETDSQVLKHVCCCEDCCTLLYEHRESLLEELRDKQTQDDFPCRKIEASHIFDYVVPYGLDPLGDQYAKFRESLTSHLRDCPTCLAKMQQLHETLYGIAQRDESDIVTVFHMHESDTTESKTDSEDIYSGFPVKVEVLSRDGADEMKTTDPCVANPPAHCTRTSWRLFGRIARIAAVLAIVGLVGNTLLFDSQDVQADRLGDIRAAIVKADHICVKMYSSDETESIQEEWISRSLNSYLIKRVNSATLYDLRENIKRTKDLETNIVTEESISRTERDQIRKKIAGTLDLVPYTLRELGNGRRSFQRIIDEKLPSRDDPERIYELTVANNMDPDYPVLHTRRFYLNPQTNRPYKVVFRQTIGDEAQVFEDVREVTYPEEAKVREKFSRIAN